ncbi:MAG TPA: sulfate permease [Actinomycetota bacterium]|jgi:high affinity sulfate transporter 1|nr:sulfate permease [Actinomycetota bacterium]
MSAASTVGATEAPSGLRRWVPGAEVLRTYQRSWLPRDLVAGLVLTALLVPAGMGYAEASGLPAIYGLYATVVPLVVYALAGPSRILVLGPDSSLAPLIAAAILPLAAGSDAEAVALAGMLAVLSGLLCVLAGLARLGFVTDLLSKPVRYGYMNGIALTVLLSQLPKLFGFSVDAEGVIPEARAFVRGVADGATNTTALVLGAASLLVILACKRWRPRIPGVLVAVVGATVAVGLFDLAQRYDVSVVGPLPEGLPSFQLPSMSLSNIEALLAGAIGIALVSFADTSVLSRTFAIRGGYRVDPNQELVALGAANLAAGFFQGFSVSASSSRTPVAEAAGARTQLTGLVGAGAIALMLLFFPNLVQHLPDSALAAVVISAAIGLVEVAGVRKLYRWRRMEFVLSIVCFLGVAVLGVIEGIFLAVGLALLDFVRRAWRPYDAVLGRVDGLKGYHDVSRYPDAKRIPGLVLFRWDAPLFFANAEIFADHVEQAVASSPTPVRWVIVTAEPVTDLDTTAADVLRRLEDELAADGIDLRFAEMKDPVKDRLKRYGLLEHFGADHFYPTIGTAVDAYLDATGVEWTDWEDRPAPTRPG